MCQDILKTQLGLQVNSPVQWSPSFYILIIDGHMFYSYKVDQNYWLVSHCSHVDHILLIIVFNVNICFKHIDEVFYHFLIAVVRCKVESCVATVSLLVSPFFDVIYQHDGLVIYKMLVDYFQGLQVVFHGTESYQRVFSQVYYRHYRTCRFVFLKHIYK